MFLETMLRDRMFLGVGTEDKIALYFYSCRSNDYLVGRSSEWDVLGTVIGYFKEQDKRLTRKNSRTPKNDERSLDSISKFS